MGQLELPEGQTAKHRQDERFEPVCRLHVYGRRRMFLSYGRPGAPGSPWRDRPNGPDLMKPAATGRILFWSGGSLWIGLAGEPADLHAHHAVQITLPFLRGRVRFRGPSGPWKSYSAVLVAADQPHAFEAREQLVAQLFVEPESREGRKLQKCHRAAGIVELPPGELDLHIAGLAAAYECRASNAALFELGRAAVAVLSGSAPEPEPRRAHCEGGGADTCAPGRHDTSANDGSGGASVAGSFSSPVHAGDGSDIPRIPALAAARMFSRRVCRRRDADRGGPFGWVCRLRPLFPHLPADVRDCAGQRPARIAVSFKGPALRWG